jgi:hypothetical protein
MKKLFVFCITSLFTLVLFSQTAALRLQAPEELPQPGDSFMIGLWLDELNHEQPVIMSAQLFIEFNGEVITPAGSNRVYHVNLHPLLSEHENNPMSNSPFPGDLRFIILTTEQSGIEIGREVRFPVKLWDIPFIYHGGSTSVKWGTANVLEPVPGEEHGGVLKKGATMVSGLNNVMYKLNLTGTSVGGE